MATRDITRLMNDCRASLPGAIDTTIQQALFGVMDDFFKDTNTWTEDIDVLIPANDPQGTLYDLIPVNPGIIDKLMWVFEAPKSSSVGVGPAVKSAMSIPGELTLYIQPTISYTVRATVALTVSDPVERTGYVTFPEWVLQKYRETIHAGVLGRMMMQPQKPFTNNQLSVFHLRKFTGGCARARVEVQRNNKYRAQAWRFPTAAGGSQRGGSGWAQPQ